MRTHLGARDDYRLRLIDRAGGEGVLTADLSRYDETWAEAFDGADAVVHLVGLLAGRPPVGPGLTPPYLDALLNVYAAAARHGVRRVVFASSVWTMAARRFDSDPIAADPMANPGDNAHGVAARLFGECKGLHARSQRAASFGVSTVVLRIGGCRDGDNDFSLRTPMPDRNQTCWLSDRDFCEGAVRAIEADLAGFAVVNLTSANRGIALDLRRGGARHRLSTRATASARRLGVSDRLRAGFAARSAARSLPALARRLTPKTW